MILPERGPALLWGGLLQGEDLPREALGLAFACCVELGLDELTCFTTSPELTKQFTPHPGQLHDQQLPYGMTLEFLTSHPAMARAFSLAYQLAERSSLSQHPSDNAWRKTTAIFGP